MLARILKGVGGFYYCEDEAEHVYECKAKGGFRKQGIKPLPGDYAEIEVLDAEKKFGNIMDIHARKNGLIRPAVANVDQMLIEFALTDPAPNLNLLDRFLLMMDVTGLPTVICFNKLDLVEDADLEQYRKIYSKSGHELLFVSTVTKTGIQEVQQCIAGKTTAFAGPSGVGKSSLLNCLMPHVKLQTGEISEKIRRGKHTTRHTELMPVGDHTYLIDTPGFSSLYMPDILPEELSGYYTEFEPYMGSCKFQPCSHTHEPECAVKKAVDAGDIDRNRYRNYTEFYEELKHRKNY